MKQMIILALLTCSFTSIAIDKAEVQLDGTNYGVLNASDREKEIDVKVEIQFHRKTIPLDQTIAALENKLNFFKLLKKFDIDNGKKITGNYKNRPLVDVLKELIPELPVEFDGIDKTTTVGSMSINEAPLERVFEFLDNASGVYFHFTPTGLTVSSTAKPPTKK